MKYFILQNLDTFDYEVVQGVSLIDAVAQAKANNRNLGIDPSFTKGYDDLDEALDAAEHGTSAGSNFASNLEGDTGSPIDKARRAANKQRRDIKKQRTNQEADPNAHEPVAEVDHGTGISDNTAEADIPEAVSTKKDPAEDGVRSVIERSQQFGSPELTDLKNANDRLLGSKTLAVVGPKSLPGGRYYSRQNASDLIAEAESILTSKIPKNGSLRVLTNLDLGFDMVVAEAAINLKKKGLPISLEVESPYSGRSVMWPEAGQWFDEIVAEADKVGFTSDVQRSKTNRQQIGELVQSTRQRVIQAADEVLTYRPAGSKATSVGTQATNMAYSLGKPVHNIYKKLTDAGVEATALGATVGMTPPPRPSGREEVSRIGASQTKSTIFSPNPRNKAYAHIKQTSGSAETLKSGSTQAAYPAGSGSSRMENAIPPSSVPPIPPPPPATPSPSSSASIPSQAPELPRQVSSQVKSSDGYRQRSFPAISPEQAEKIQDKYGGEIEEFNYKGQKRWRVTWYEPIKGQTKGQLVEEAKRQISTADTASKVVASTPEPPVTTRPPMGVSKPEDVAVTPMGRVVNQASFPTDVSTEALERVRAQRAESILASLDQLTLDRIAPPPLDDTVPAQLSHQPLDKITLERLASPPMSSAPAAYRRNESRSETFERLTQTGLGVMPYHHQFTGFFGQAIIGSAIGHLFDSSQSTGDKVGFALRDALSSMILSSPRASSIDLTHQISQMDHYEAAKTMAEVSIGAVAGTAMSMAAERMASRVGPGSASLARLAGGIAGWASAAVIAPIVTHAFIKLREAAYNNSDLEVGMMEQTLSAMDTTRRLMESASQQFEVEFADEYGDELDYADDSDLPTDVDDITDDYGNELDYAYE